MTRSMRIVAIALLACVASVPVLAQEIKRNQTVDNRPRPDYDARGLPAGVFNIFPTMEVDYVWDDNIRPFNNIELDDEIILVRPGIEVRSDWVQHQFLFGGEAESSKNDEFDSEEYDDWEVYTGGRYDFTRAQLEGRISYADLHEPRTSPNDAEESREPTEFSETEVNLRHRYRPNRFFTDTRLRFLQLDFDDAVSFLGGPIENDDRDRDILDGRVRVGYQVSPDYAVFFEPRLYDINYDEKFDRFGDLNRDAEGYDLVGGVELDLTGVIFGELFVGYRNIDYDNFEEQDGITYGLDMDWNITRLTTIGFRGSQTIDGTTVEGSSGIETNRIGATIDHELRRNIILSAGYAFRNEDFQDVERDDDITNFDIGARYLLNRYLSVRGGYDWEERESSTGGAEFTINKIYIGFILQI